MTRAAMLLAACCALVPLCGCGLVTQEQVLAKMDEVWADKGAEAVADKVAELVADGKLTQAQGDAIIAAAQRGYEALREKVENL